MTITWRITLALGLAVTGLGLWVLGQFPQTGAGYPPGYGEPVYAFEMARTPADLIAIFGTADDPDRPARIAAMDRGNLWDYPFMVIYGLFIAAFFTAAAQARQHRGWLIFASLGVVAALADGVENQILLGLTSDLDAAPHLALLVWPVWTKFFALLICGVAAGVYLVQQPVPVWKIGGALAIAGALAVPLAFWEPSAYAQYMGLGLSVCWTLKLVFAARRSFGQNPS